MPTRREVVDASSILPGVTHAGWTRVKTAGDTRLGAHDHGPAYELCLVVGGAVDWWVEDQVYEVRAGDAFLTRPRERHGGVDAVLQPCELYWAGFTLDAKQPLAGLSAAERLALAKRFKAARLRHFAADAAVRRAFAQLIDASGSRGALTGLAARTAFVQLLLDALRCHDLAQQQTRAVTTEVRAAMDWMGQRLGEDFAIDDAATVAGLSVTRFHERFRAEVGLSPGEWRTRRRIALAKALLRDRGLSVTQVAMRCGFSTSQYFATAFKRQTGVSPGAYRDQSA